MPNDSDGGDHSRFLSKVREKRRDTSVADSGLKETGLSDRRRKACEIAFGGIFENRMPWPTIIVDTFWGTRGKGSW